MSQSSFDVVIVGAGPTGLCLAMELALAGVQPLVLERLALPDQSAKAMAVGALAGEALERRGFADEIAAEEMASSALMRSMRPTSGQASNDNLWKSFGGHFSALFLIDQARQRAPERRMRGLKQAVLEAMLSERVRAMGIALRRGEELLDFTQNDGGVRLEVRAANGETYTLDAQYLVGCDGGHSQVRKRAGFEFPGTAPTMGGLQVIADVDKPERLLPAGWRRTQTGVMSYGPVPGRMTLVRFDGASAERAKPITREEVEDTLRYVSGADVRVERVHNATRWTDNARQTTTYRLGRVFLAGDAAHVHSPLGGQGLGLGLIDAVNLGWKLASTVRGGAPHDLLDSYTTERHPVAARVLANTRAQVALLRPDELTGALRGIVADIMTSDWGTRYFGEMMSGVAVRYDLGEPHPDVGMLIADRVLETENGAVSIAALMREGGALLIDGSGEASKLAAVWGPALRCVRTHETHSQLIRPDGCIAWARHGADTDGLISACTRWFGSALRAAPEPHASSSPGTRVVASLK